MIAAASGHTTVVQLLLGAEADRFLKNKVTTVQW